jgi:hypothetical protein
MTQLLAVLGIVSVAVEPAQMIVKDGKANAQIVVAAEKRPRMVTLAALELRHWEGEGCQSGDV